MLVAAVLIRVGFGRNIVAGGAFALCKGIAIGHLDFAFLASGHAAAALLFKRLCLDLFRNRPLAPPLSHGGESSMPGSPTTHSIKTLVVIFGLAAMPAMSFAQGTGGS